MTAGSMKVDPARVGPTVTIGLPLYNEERFVEQTFRSLLAQSFGDFELIVSDNASTDRTSDICRTFAAVDPRIVYNRNDTNIGAAANFDRVIHMARGSYFLWAGGHDLWDEHLVKRSVDVLDGRPEATIAVAECQWIDGEGHLLGRHSGLTDTSGMSEVERLFTVLWGNMHPILGLMRTEHLKGSRGVQRCMGADLLLLSELALRGDFVLVPGTRWYRREIRPQETYAQMMRRHRSPQYRLSTGAAARFPLLVLGRQLLGIAWRAPWPWTTRLAACLGLLFSMPARYLGARQRRK